ncbi:Motility protein B [Pseudomonas sp. MM227]|uniref:Flagellar motor protein MotD n=1 Tax=Pseudomonas baltica TaxID=2762576 RepID=A0A7X1G6K2_9PSED|nr:MULTISPECIES: flagellar motor protein MotD [Pseudomonas]MBC2679121.1 flagellar motor protein MotD [Pseudomonas baltica]MBD8592469.1 flagellar motor protein MotD [Pseudomonas sp. CFBP 8758]MBD8604319.1 flagellar motor protein MotD [Pseudomonas sp. CFBP 8771]MBD8732335.1 flagellar motor protein MotD [Pseudomonas sp. CFBP 13710]MBD8825512.1 flagellar motor protein MotD [Pseudomonas sp. CFBP 13602]
MARRRRLEEPENHERWLVSYADFITLLFAFFVVMYSISSVNEGKYKVLSQALVGVFSDPDRSVRPIPIGEERPLTTRPVQPLVTDSEQSEAAIGEAVDPLQTIADNVRQAFGDLIASDQLTVRGNELWIEIELKSSLLFGSGDAMPSDMAFAIVDKVAGILKPFDNPVHVEGFTDNLPISTAQFPTNWELSTARAASIVRMMAMEGIDPRRMAAVGYGEFQPVADNASADGRGRNRRVVLVISRNLDVRRSITSSGSANAQPDAALRRAGTQTAKTPLTVPSAPGSVKSPPPGP